MHMYHYYYYYYCEYYNVFFFASFFHFGPINEIHEKWKRESKISLVNTCNCAMLCEMVCGICVCIYSIARWALYYFFHIKQNGIFIHKIIGQSMLCYGLYVVVFFTQLIFFATQIYTYIWGTSEFVWRANITINSARLVYYILYMFFDLSFALLSYIWY